MLKACLDMTRSVSLPGFKGSWVIRSKDTVEVDGDVFVRMDVKNSSLSTMLGNVDGFYCLSRSEGLKEILKMRNQESERSEGCTLFDEQQPNKKRLSRSGAAKERCEHTKTVEVPIDEKVPKQKVMMLKAVHPTDCAWILFEEDTISFVLNFVLKKGFTVKKRLRNPDKLPRGISRLSSGGFSVKYMSNDIVKCKKLNNMESALAFHSDPDAYFEQEQLAQAEQPEDPEEFEEPEEAEQHES